MARLYVADLDGTLLRPNSSLSAHSWNALTQCLHNGCAFTVASGRSVPSMQPILRGLPLRLPVVAINGAIVADLVTGKILRINGIDKAVLTELLALFRKKGAAPLVFSMAEGKERLTFDNLGSKGMRDYIEDRTEAGDPRFVHLGDVEESFLHDVVSFGLIDKKGPATEMRDAIQENFGNLVTTVLYENLYYSGWFWLTIHDQSSTKAYAVQWLMDEFGFSRSQLTAFGDDVNDLSLLELADTGVAVENAVPEVKAIASKVIGPNAHDSVARYIQAKCLAAYTETNT